MFRIAVIIILLAYPVLPLNLDSQPPDPERVDFKIAVKALKSGHSLFFFTFAPLTDRAFGGNVDNFKYYDEPKNGLPYFEFSKTRLILNESDIQMQLLEEKVDINGNVSVRLTTMTPAEFKVIRREEWTCNLRAKYCTDLRITVGENPVLLKADTVPIRKNLTAGIRVRFTVNFSLCHTGLRLNVVSGGYLSDFKEYDAEYDELTQFSTTRMVTNGGSGIGYDVDTVKMYTNGTLAVNTAKMTSNFKPLNSEDYICDMNGGDKAAVSFFAINSPNW
ncbi:uncharacterized protein LOC106155668 [Lingula anatina]|uniref:Uncharacterized protein LOC106155668 n=1 Tax=Lingula anatina TaxID=7574 RepID=A0A1S3HIV7_LINAN|nr:uncharacterized protein LOC106155668 [Lingula anatina]|eukprot:XP_013386055.1 uncharacterized protein LOC106155668 [Lingula anatina]